MVQFSVSRSLGRALLGLGLCALALGAGREAAARAVIHTPANTYVLRNANLEISLRFENDSILLTEFTNHLTGQVYPLDGFGPRVHLTDGTLLTLRDFHRVIQEERPDYTDRQRCLAFSVVSATYDVEMIMVFELGHEDRYLRFSAEVAASTSDVLYAIRRLDYLAGPIGQVYERGGLGQPLFIDDQLFVGVEYPAAYNVVEDGSVFLTLRTVADLQTREGTWKAPSMVFGVARPGELRDTFVNHYMPTLNKIYKDIVVYNPRYDLRGDEVAPPFLRGRYQTLLNRIRDASGPLLDGLLLEEDWGERNSLFGFQLGRLPNGLGSLRAYPDLTGVEMGLALSLSGGRSNVAWLKEQGYRADPAGRHVYMNDPRYGEDVRNRMEYLRRSQEAIYFKYLDLRFDSVLGASGEIVDASGGLDSNVRAFLDLVRHIGGPQETIQWYVNPAWDSPWWMKELSGIGYADSGEQPELDWNSPAALPRDAAISHDWGLLHQKLAQSDLLVPLPELVNDDIVASARAGLGATDEALERWCDAVLLACARGSRIMELSVDGNLLGHAQTLALGRLLAWGELHREFLRKGRLYGGDPRRGEVHGVLAADNNRALFVLRNPKLAPETHRIALQEALGEGPGRFWAWVEYPYHQRLHERLNRDSILEVPINGLETLVVQVENGMIARERADLQTFWNAPASATAYMTVGTQGIAAARPITTASATVKVETDPGVQKAELGVLVRGSADPAAEYQIHARINGASVGVARRLSGPDWQLTTYPLEPGDNDIRVWLEERPIASERRAETLSLWGLVAGIPDSATPSLVMRTREEAGFLPALGLPGHRRVTPIVGETALLQSRYEPAELEGEAVLRRARRARLVLQVFGSDAGPLADKRLMLNGRLLGRLPANQEPVDSWQAMSVPVPDELLATLGVRNTLVVENPVGDYFKVKHLALLIDTGSDSWKGTEMVREVFTSAKDWPHEEGTRFETKSPEIPLNFKLKSRP